MKWIILLGATIGFSEQEYVTVEGDGPVIFEFGVLAGNLAFSVDVLFFTTDGSALGISQYPL